MSKAIKLLVAEDSEDDAKLVIRMLRRGGFDARYERVQTAAAMEAALRRQTWDAVISDYNMPGFSGLDALRILRSTELDIPFILISGTVGEEIAVDALKAGAGDYVLKKNLSRLPSVLERELKEAATRAEHRRAQRDLVESESRYREMFLANPHPMWVYDPETLRFLSVNDAAVAHYGWSREEFLAMTISDIRSAGEVQRALSQVARVRDQGFVEAGVWKHRKENGAILDVEITSHAIDFGGQRARVVLAYDITDRLAAERMLRENEAWLRQAQQINKLAHVVARPDGLFENWSETLPALIGMDSAGMPKSTREWLTLVHTDEHAMFRDKCNEVGETRTRVDMDYRLRRGDGAWIHIRHVIDPLQEQSDDAGRARWFNTLQDVTGQKRAEEGLRESEARFRSLTELSSDFYWETDAEHRMAGIRHGRQHMTVVGGWQRGKTRWETPSTRPDAAGWAAHRATLDARKPFRDFEIARIDAEGVERHLSINGEPVFDESGVFKGYRGVGKNITERKQAEDRIRRLNRVYAVLSGINAAIVRVRDRNELLREACRIAVEDGGFGIAQVLLIDEDAYEVWPGPSAGVDTLPVVRASFRPGAETISTQGTMIRAIRERKPVFSNDITAEPPIGALRAEALRRGYGSVISLALMVRDRIVAVMMLYAKEKNFFNEEELRLLRELAGDVSFALEHIEKAQKLDYLAFYDSLTGLANRTLFLDRLKQAIHAAAQSQGKFALVLADIERLRTVNESLGRHAGDALLNQVAERLARVAGRAEVGRISADQFAVVLPTVKGRSEAGRIIQTLMHACFNEPFALIETKLKVSAKTGIALHPNDGGDAETLLKHAEAALRKGKETGERFAFYTPGLTERTVATLTLENKLRQALDNEEFVLHYQPKVDLEMRRIVGVEALIRWQSPELGLVPPMKFIPLMEETGMILEAGAWALRRAAIDHRSWVEQRLQAPRVAVNVSAIQLRQRDFVGAVEQAISEGIAPTGIDLEITESLIMRDIDGTIQKLKEVRALGVSIAIDDFGTGYSSLAYLAKLPVQTLKIDRSFIITMLNDPDTMTLVQTMISLAHSLRLTVVAEGVDAEEQAKMLRLLRCDQMQGYLFSKPVPFDDMTALLKNGTKA